MDSCLATQHCATSSERRLKHACLPVHRQGAVFPSYNRLQTPTVNTDSSFGSASSEWCVAGTLTPQTQKRGGVTYATQTCLPCHSAQHTGLLHTTLKNPPVSGGAAACVPPRTTPHLPAAAHNSHPQLHNLSEQPTDHMQTKTRNITIKKSWLAQGCSPAHPLRSSLSAPLCGDRVAMRTQCIHASVPAATPPPPPPSTVTARMLHNSTCM